MPKISLVVCPYKERALLERLLQHAEGCYDDLVVVHDGPENESRPPTSLSEIYIPSHRHPELAADFSIPEQAAKASVWWKTPEGPPIPGSIHELVTKYGGRYFEGPRCWQQEPHWPFAWSQAKHDWILRLDADEFPSSELRSWLQNIRKNPSLPSSGFSALWPPWNGTRVITKKIPPFRIFFFNRQQVTFFGMAENGPSLKTPPEELLLEIVHQPVRKSIGPGNLLLREQAYRWRRVIGLSLQKTPLELPRWRMNSPDWPLYWEQMRQKPLRTALKRALLSIPREWRHCRKNGYDFLPEAAVGTALHKFLLPLAFWYYQRRRL
jgi:hypothetical protein